MIAFLLLETLMLGVFMALDLVLFYLFFEAGLIPMFLIIGIWGGKERIYASFQVLPLYLPWLGSDAGRDGGDVCEAGTTDIPTLMTIEFDCGLDDLGLCISWAACRRCCSWRSLPAFAVKMPMWPVHTWLPDAHVQAPTAGLCCSGGDPSENGRLWVLAL